MEHYTVEVEVATRHDLTNDGVDAAMNYLEAYAPALSVTPRGHQQARLTFPASSLEQAVTTAARVVAAAFSGPPIRVEAMTEREADRRDGEEQVPDLISTSEAAEILGCSRQRIRQMIDEGKLAAHRVGERSIALLRREVAAKAAHA